MGEPYSAVREAAAEANRALAAAGLVVAAFGNASQADRDQDVFAIKPSGIPCGEVTAANMVVLSLSEGELVWGDRRPSSDTPTHGVLYSALPVGGVVHTHSVSATAWAQARRPIPCLGTTHADHFRGPIPVTRPLTAEEIAGDYEANTGRVIAELFDGGGFDPEETPGALVASHGPFVWGADASTAAATAAAVEVMADLASRTLAIEPSLGQIEEELLDRHFSRKHGPLAYYGQP